jgi:hypothetical protein
MDIYKNMNKSMQRIKTFRTFESMTGGLTPEQKIWLDECIGENAEWGINDEGLVDVNGNFSCIGQGLSDFKGVRFGKVSGYFSCIENNITSLDGAPQEVGEGFFCQDNNLVSLTGSPQIIKGNFYCNDNRLTSLEGAPSGVDGDGSFYCHNNFLTSLVGAPPSVKINFDCENNPLQTLIGAPLKIGGRFRFSAELEGPEFDIPKGQWGPAGWVKALETIDDPKARALILTLLDPDDLNKRFRDQPEQTMIDLQGAWNLPGFAPIRKQLKVPKRYRDDMDLLGDMKELGF